MTFLVSLLLVSIVLPSMYILAERLWLRRKARSAPPGPQSLDEFQQRVGILYARSAWHWLVTLTLCGLAFATLTDASAAFARGHPWWTEQLRVLIFLGLMITGLIYPFSREDFHAIRLGLVCPHCRHLTVGSTLTGKDDDALTQHALKYEECGRCKRKLFPNGIQPTASRLLRPPRPRAPRQESAVKTSRRDTLRQFGMAVAIAPVVALVAMGVGYTARQSKERSAIARCLEAYDRARTAADITAVDAWRPVLRLYRTCGELHRAGRFSSLP